jgi:NhaP-type Na+/H+ or K+/H+ antiporter
VTCGIVTKIYGANMINQQELMNHFWSTTEHLLNTVLFALAGVVWGSTISNSGDDQFEARDWGYLIVLYVFLTLIRFFLMYTFFPLTVNIGLSTSWQESFFASFGGLRGAVGLSLAITIDNEVREYADSVPGGSEWTHRLFGMVGGIAFLTLLINGSLAGPLLVKLGLADASEARQKIVGHFRELYDEFVIDTFVHKLTDVRFCSIDYQVVRKHIPPLQKMDLAGFMAAVERNKQLGPSENYEAPHIENVLRWYEANNASSHFDNANAKTPSNHHFHDKLKVGQT